MCGISVGCDSQPFADGNTLIGTVDVGTLHIVLAASGFFGLMFWLLLADTR